MTFLKKIQYQLILWLQPRKNITHTLFQRFQNQNRVVLDRVLPFLLGADNRQTAPLEIILFGSSSGAEPYSLASMLINRRPGLQFKIRAYDIVPEVVTKAQGGKYSNQGVHNTPGITKPFIAETFDDRGEIVQVKANIAATVTFEVGSILDDALIAKLGQADMVFAQNFLFHLKPSQARVAFVNLAKLLKPRSALFVDGMDTKMRIELTKKFNLEPVQYLIEEVHNEAFGDRGANWSNRYWGREPFSTDDKEWVRKYCTVYTKSS